MSVNHWGWEEANGGRVGEEEEEAVWVTATGRFKRVGVGGDTDCVGSSVQTIPGNSCSDIRQSNFCSERSRRDFSHTRSHLKEGQHVEGDRVRQSAVTTVSTCGNKKKILVFLLGWGLGVDFWSNYKLLWEFARPYSVSHDSFLRSLEILLENKSTPSNFHRSA